MITVAGEALIDLVIESSGSVKPLPGGASFNVARMIARLGGDCQYVGTLSDDRFGEELRSLLEEAGVTVAVPDHTPAPTTLSPTNPVTPGVFLTAAHDSSVRSIRTRMYPGRTFSWTCCRLPPLISVTSCVGTSIWKM